ncbi:MAG: META domain-containing protein [Phormidesmis sp.]
MAVVLLSTGVVACSEPANNDFPVSSATEGTEQFTPDEMMAIEGTTWKLVSYSQTPVLPESEITLELANGKLNGSAGCNSYFADYKLDNNQLMVDRAGATKKFCGEPGVMAQEDAYLSLLQQTDSAIAVTGNSLTIETSEGNLVFESAS